MSFALSPCLLPSSESQGREREFRLSSFGAFCILILSGRHLQSSLHQITVVSIYCGLCQVGSYGLLLNHLHIHEHVCACLSYFYIPPTILQDGDSLQMREEEYSDLPRVTQLGAGGATPHPGVRRGCFPQGPTRTGRAGLWPQLCCPPLQPWWSSSKCTLPHEGWDLLT